MPKPNPNGETRDEWLDRCIPVLVDEGRERSQAVAICISMWQQVEEGNIQSTEDVLINVDMDEEYFDDFNDFNELLE